MRSLRIVIVAVIIVAVAFLVAVLWTPIGLQKPGAPVATPTDPANNDPGSVQKRSEPAPTPPQAPVTSTSPGAEPPSAPPEPPAAPTPRPDADTNKAPAPAPGQPDDAGPVGKPPGDHAESEQQKRVESEQQKRVESERQHRVGSARTRSDRKSGADILSGADTAGIVEICLIDDKCTPVRIFFNTDRQRADLPKRIAYSAERSPTTEFGTAVVTVPRVKRAVGTVTRPSWIERNIWRVPPEGDPARHFTIPDGGIAVYATVDEFIAAMRLAVANGGRYKDHAFVFVHGFDNTFDDALYRTAQIAYDLGNDDNPFGTAFLYSWPSRGEATPAGYGYDEDSARFAADHLTEFIKLIAEKSGATHVHVIAHSMGNLALLTALQSLAGPQVKTPIIDQLILAAPDVDAGWFETVAAKITPLAHNTTLYASSRDLAMRAAKNFRAGALRAGDVSALGPAIASGVESLDISAVDSSIFSTGHAEYAENQEMLADIGRLFRDGASVHPPQKRANFAPRGVGDRMFWLYAK